MRDTLSFTLTSDEYVATVQRITARAEKALELRWLHTALVILLFAILGGLFTYLVSSPSSARISGGAVALCLGIILLLYGLLAGLQKRRWLGSLRKSTHATNFERTWVLEPLGLREKSAKGESFTPWTGILAVEDSPDFVFLYLDNIYSLSIPTRAFEGEVEHKEFVAMAREQVKAASSQTVVTSQPATAEYASPFPESPPVAGVVTPPLRTRINSVVANAFRLAFLRRVPEDTLDATWLKVALAAAFSLLLPTLYMVATLGTHGTIEVYGLPSTVFHLAVLLIASIAVAYLLGRPGDVVLLLYAGLLAYCAIDAMSLLASAIAKGFASNYRFIHGTFSYLPATWFTLAVARYAITLAPSAAPRQAWILVVSALLIGLPLGGIYRERSLWTEDYNERSEDVNNSAMSRRAVGAEDAFYAQPRILERELAAVKPGRKGVVDVFFVGMAGYGYQDVFMREIDSVAKLFRERFDADGRIIKLVNNPKTVMSSPVASVTSLRASLKRIAESMDVEEDVLVLFLTSHGSAKHEFTLHLYPLTFNELTPAVLRGLLDESGIKNRVVIISACYAGGFIESLRGENTLVIAAAAPDKNSFGCSNENAWTYFGKAYFDEALRKTYSFTQAFEAAKPVIAEREKKEDFDPSDPQMAIGAGLKPVLAKLEQQLSAPRVSEPELTASVRNVKDKDAIDHYVALMFDDAQARAYRDSCKLNMALSGPDKTLERTPEVLGGLDKRSLLWPRLVGAWESYAEDFCAKANDPAWLRSSYRRQVETHMGDKDVAAAMQFLSSKSGRNWLVQEKAISLGQVNEMAKFQLEMGAELYQKYRKEEEQVYVEFRKGDGSGRKAQ